MVQQVPHAEKEVSHIPTNLWQPTANQALAKRRVICVQWPSSWRAAVMWWAFRWNAFYVGCIHIDLSSQFSCRSCIWFMVNAKIIILHSFHLFFFHCQPCEAKCVTVFSLLLLQSENDMEAVSLVLLQGAIVLVPSAYVTLQTMSECQNIATANSHRQLRSDYIMDIVFWSGKHVGLSV